MRKKKMNKKKKHRTFPGLPDAMQCNAAVEVRSQAGGEKKLVRSQRPWERRKKVRKRF